MRFLILRLSHAGSTETSADGNLTCHMFLADDDWKAISEFEAIFSDTSRLTLVCQNEEKLNGACRPVMWKSLHDSVPRETMELINARKWSSYKCMVHLTRSEEYVNSFNEAGKHEKREHHLNVIGHF